jgi:adenine phosphoribosyltransferase
VATDTSWLVEHVRDVADFPKPGVVFKDITPLLGDPSAFRGVVDAIADRYPAAEVDRVVGIEARGFIVAAPVAYRLGAGFAPVRKPGKLPGESVAEPYELEYGVDSLEVHVDAVEAGERVLVVDDVIATGGTALATCKLIERLGARVIGIAAVIELGFLGGRARLDGYDVASLITYEDG